MRGGGRGPTEAYAAYAAGRAEVANDADGPFSATCPLRISLGRERVRIAAGPVEGAHARPHALAPSLQRREDGALVGRAHAPAVDHEAAVDPDPIDVLGRRVVDDILHRIAHRRHAQRGALPDD